MAKKTRPLRRLWDELVKTLGGPLLALLVAELLLQSFGLPFGNAGNILVSPTVRLWWRRCLSTSADVVSVTLF